jgi:hypothetical protein
MVDFYTSRDATEMMAFVLECHPEISQIRQLNPGLPAVKDLPDIEYFRLSDSVKQRGHDADSTGSVDQAAAADLETVPVSKQPTRIYSIDERTNPSEILAWISTPSSSHAATLAAIVALAHHANSSSAVFAEGSRFASISSIGLLPRIG